MKLKTLRMAACTAAPLMLAACCGGGSSPSLTDNAIDRSDPRVIRLGGILERSDTLPGIPHMEPSQPVECDSKPLDGQFAFE